MTESGLHAVVWARGAGPPLLLVPSAQGHPAFFDLIARRLATAYRVWVPLLPGERGREAEGSADFPDLARDLLQLPLWREADRVYLVGTSFGAALALWLACHHPDRFRGVVLHATPWRVPRWRVLHARIATVRTRAGWWLVGTVFRYGSLLLLAHEVLRLPRAVRRAYRAWFLQRWRRYRTPTVTMGRRIGLLAGLPERLPARRLEVPCRVLCGEPGRDWLVPHECQEDLCATFGLEPPQVVPGTGHLGPWTHPERFVQAVGDALRAMTIQDSPRVGLV